jgi:hypothetical protein
MRTVLQEDPRQAHKKVSSPSVAATNVSPKWYSGAYLAQVFAKRPAQMLALFAFIAVAGVLIYVFAAGSESTNLAFASGVTSNTTVNSSTNTVTLTQTTSGGTNHAPQCGGETGTPPATFDHVILIMMENNSYSSVIGHAPTYIDPVLTKQCGIGTNFKDTISSNSLPHYMKLTSGVENPTADCSYNASSCHSTSNNIFNQLGIANWKSYEEGLSSAGSCTSTHTPPGYAARHDPPVFYDDIPGHTCPSNIVSFSPGVYNSGNLYTDLNNNALPKFSLITPDVPDDMHVLTTGGASQVATGDTWLSHWIPVILNSKTYTQSNTVVFIFWDEGDSGGTGQSLPNFVISPWTGNLKPTTTYDDCTAFHVMEQLTGVAQLTCVKGADETTAGGATPASTFISDFKL